MRRAVAAAVLCLATATPAAAASGRWGSFEIDAGPYSPDNDAGLASPAYERTFGTRRRFMFRLGVSRALLTRMGSLEVGLRTGYFQASGKGWSVIESTDPGTPPSFVPSGDSTAFRIVPSSAFLTYRFDWAAERYPVPLAPYVTVALERYNWWITDGAGHSAQNGATNGWSAAAGVALLLDFFDRQMAREMDQDTGINHTYAFAELGKAWIDDFGSSRSWDLSDKGFSFSFGLLFVF